jgi:hypothetical protein
VGELRRLYSSDGEVIRTVISNDSDPWAFHVKHSQDVEPILDSIARDREVMSNRGYNKLSHRIPTIIYEQLQLKGIADDPDRFKAWLNSSEADPWRIWPGRL